MRDHETIQDHTGYIPRPPEAILDANRELEHRRVPALAKLTAASSLFTALALGATGCLHPPDRLVSSSVHIETLPQDDAPVAQTMLRSLQHAMSNFSPPLQGKGLSLDSMIKANGMFTQWANTNKVDPQPVGPPMPGDVVLAKTGATAIIREVRTAIDSWGDAKTTIILTNGAKLSTAQISKYGRALLPVPQSDPTAAASKSSPHAPTQTPSTGKSPGTAAPTPESKPTSASSVEKARTDIVNTMESELFTQKHAGQSPYQTIDGTSVWPDFLDYINATAPDVIGKDPDWCALLVSFILDKAGHPLDGGDPTNPSALYRVYDIPGESTPIKALTLQQWVVEHGSYWSYGETGIKPKPGDILFLNGDGDGSTMDHTGIVISMKGTTLTYAAGNDGNRLVFEKDTVDINDMQHVLMAIGSIFPQSSEQYSVAVSNYSPESLVTTPSGLSIDQLNNMLAGTGLSGLGEAFHDLEQKYGINALFAAAHAANESNFGESAIARTKKNLFGINAVDSDPDEATRYSSYASSIEAYGHLLASGYLTSREPYYGGGVTIADIFKHYSTDPQEPQTVANIMNQLLQKVGAPRAQNY